MWKEIGDRLAPVKWTKRYAHCYVQIHRHINTRRRHICDPFMVYSVQRFYYDTRLRAAWVV